MPTLDTARTPDGLRIYAIGDIHGRADLLSQMQTRIAADRIARPCQRARIIYLGDYIDRGPDSAGVVDLLACALQDGDTVCLTGNHDQYLKAFLADPDTFGDIWLRYGGVEALASWGINAFDARFLNSQWHRLRDALADALPDRHSAFFAGLSFMERHGDFVFVHAGLRPGLALTKQRVQDLTTIREPFLTYRGDFGAVVVHGHTVVPQPEFHANRIAIDTKAYASGTLTCLVLEGEQKGLLTTEGYVASKPQTPR